MTQNDPVPKLPKKERAAGCWCRALNMHMRLAHVFLRIAREPKLFRQNLDLLEKSHGTLRPGGVLRRRAAAEGRNGVRSQPLHGGQLPPGAARDPPRWRVPR